MKQGIPEQDIQLINDSFKMNEAVPTIIKDFKGDDISRIRQTVNPRQFVIKDFRGRTLIHQKSFIPVGGEQMVIGVKGQRFDDISLETRKLVEWCETDFE